MHDQRIDDAFVRFEQMERRLDTAEGQVEAFDLGRSATLADEIEELAADSVVEAELQELKVKLGMGRAVSLSAMDMLEVPLILFLVIVAPIWIIAHYLTRWRMAKSLSPEDEKQFAELWQTAERMEQRIDSIERILEAEEPQEEKP